MLPAPSYSDLDTILNDPQLGDGFAGQALPTGRSVVGFLFFDQDFDRNPVSDFLANINLLNEHSGSLIHFLLPGVSLYGPNQGDKAVPLGEIAGTPTYHNSKAFISFKEEFEKQIPQWEYQYGVDLILLDIVEVDGRRVLDFKSAIFFKVEELIQLRIVDRTSELLGKLIKFRRETRSATAKELKARLSEQFGVNWFKSLILAVFPKSLQKLAKAQAVLGGGSALR